MSIFDLMDVMGDKELTLDEFIEGLEIFELNFSERDLKSVFLEIEGGGEVDDEDELEDMVIDFELFLEFMTKPSAHPTAIRFKREIYRKKLPEVDVFVRMKTLCLFSELLSLAKILETKWHSQNRSSVICAERGSGTEWRKFMTISIFATTVLKTSTARYFFFHFYLIFV